MISLILAAVVAHQSGHIPCGEFSFNSPAEVRRDVPADHVTTCFGKPMTRDEAIEFVKRQR